MDKKIAPGLLYILKVERMGLGKVYGVGANNEVDFWVDDSPA